MNFLTRTEAIAKHAPTTDESRRAGLCLANVRAMN